MFGGLSKLLKRAGNTVNNDVVRPVQRATNTLLGGTSTAAPGVKFDGPGYGIRKVQPAPYQSIPRPNIQTPIRPEIAQTPEVKKDIQRAKSLFHWTPEFEDIVARANPQITSKLDSSGLNHSQAAGTFGYKPGSFKPIIPGIPDTGFTGQQQLNISPKYANPIVITHEGLHAAFQDNPYIGQDFGPVYNAADKIDPNVGDYIKYRIQNYKENQNNPKQNFNDIRTLNPSLRNEAHSYLSEYPLVTHAPLPTPLKKYYSKYINVPTPHSIKIRRGGDTDLGA